MQANKLGLPDRNVCLDILVQVNPEPEFQILVPVSILVPLGPINWGVVVVWWWSFSY
jgi:hypothetical protein